VPVHVQIVTPEGVALVDEQARIVSVPGATGEIGIEEGHDDLLTELVVGQVRIGGPNVDAPQEHVAVSGGLLEVVDGKVLILAETAERAGDIDAARARAAKARAEGYLARRSDPDVDVARAEAALARALNRLDTIAAAGAEP